MASLYTDEAREARYAKLRTKKKRLDITLDIIMRIVLFTMGLGVVINAIGGLLSVLSLNFLDGISFLLDLAMVAAVVYAIYKRDRLTSAIVLGITIVFPMIRGFASGFGLSVNLFAPVIMIAVLIVDVQWYQLSQEEGFPLFDISYQERQERQKQLEKVSLNRAVASGVRMASTEQNSDMSDLLDAGFDRPVMAQPLSGYHERMKDAKPGVQRAAGYQPGVMDMLEEIGGPSASEQTSADEMPEI